MKRNVIIGTVLTVLICACIALNSKILEPADFTGAWYHAGDGVRYTFEEGLIKCVDHEVITLGDTAFSGAYSFAKNKVAIFIVDQDGVGEVVELQLIHRQDGDVLCEINAGDKIVWFYRSQDMDMK